LSDRFNYRYHSPETTRVVHKESVTEIKRKNDTQPDDAKVIRHTRQVNLKEPNFKRDRVEAPIFGTIMHEVMMHLLNDWNAFSILDRKSTRLNSSHVSISYAVSCLKKKNGTNKHGDVNTGK